MQDIIKKIEIMECDYHRTLPPKQVVSHAMSAVLEYMRATGGDRDRLYDTCGAVWMITHMKFRQHAIIYPEYELRFHVHPRVIDGGHYTFRAEVFRGEEPIVDFSTAFVPVHKTERHVLRLSLSEPIWTENAVTDASVSLHRLRPSCEFRPCGSDCVRMSDCDINHHLTSSAYLALICDALDYWNGSDSRYMREMQVDFTSEVMPGTLLQYERGEQDGAKFARGVKPDGKIAFTARCVYD